MEFRHQFGKKNNYFRFQYVCHKPRVSKTKMFQKPGSEALKANLMYVVFLGEQKEMPLHRIESSTNFQPEKTSSKYPRYIF